MMMTSMPKKIGRVTWRAAARMSLPCSSLSASSSRRRRMFSITTMAPSTMMPKSIAPSDSRLAGILKWCIRMNAVSSDSGIVMATMIAARGLPRNSSSTIDTSVMPSMSVLPTVCTVASTSLLRSIYGTIFTSLGRMCSFRSRTASCTPAITRDGFSFLSSSVMPSMVSGLLSMPRMPCRSRLPSTTRPRSLTSTGTPFFWLTTTLPRSSRLRIRPTPRITSPCSPRCMTLPPAFALLAAMACVIWFSERLYLDSLAGSSSSMNCVVMPPKLTTSTTPDTCLRRGMTFQTCSSDSSRRSRVLDCSV